ncbi:MAG TPA: hypothetical protein VFB72_11910 [Verrucomicrobiae bacterium]|nr:hypothetical protein [Verrucomicrobiae bacterium]
MIYGRQRLSPTDVPTFFSAIAGLFTVKLIHAHDVTRLIVLNVLWLAWLGLISLRAKFHGGKLLSFDCGLYQGFAIAFYLLGLLMACVYYLVYYAG